ncbi:MAG: hypothetical protein GX078_03540 [Clostridiales bacterium]|nr:hypothetical protein [Clostridiales bacterium]
MTNRYEFTVESRKAYEELPTSLAIYQQLDGKIVPLLFSDGICKSTGKTREELYNMSIREVYGDVHVADIYKLADDTFNCIKSSSSMNTNFRTRFNSEEDYKLINCKCYKKEMQKNFKLSFFEFNEIHRLLE